MNVRKIVLWPLCHKVKYWRLLVLVFGCLIHSIYSCHWLSGKWVRCYFWFTALPHMHCSYISDTPPRAEDISGNFTLFQSRAQQESHETQNSLKTYMGFSCWGLNTSIDYFSHPAYLLKGDILLMLKLLLINILDNFLLIHVLCKFHILNAF